MAKLCIILVLARYYDYKDIGGLSIIHRGLFQGFILPFFIVALPSILIAKQPDLGSAIILVLIFLTMSYAAGTSFNIFIGILALFVISSPVLWHLLENYQKQRLLVFLNPNIDPLGAGYTVIQSKIAVGSGGFCGKGWLSGTQSQLHFLPEAHTDFIFATWAEERGFLGSIALLSLYFLLVRQIIEVANRAQDNFARFICVGIASMFIFQIAANILMTIGQSPVVGLPLPFMSYGGSSLFVSFLSLAIVANIDKARTVFK